MEKKKLHYAKIQNNTILVKGEKKKPERKRRENENRFRLDSNLGSLSCRAISLPLHHKETFC